MISLVPLSIFAMAGVLQDPGASDGSRQPIMEFPERAAARGIDSGDVVLNCAVLADGGLADCRIVSEDPAGAGFGQAALQGTRQARVSVKSADRAGQGARITFTVRFRAADEALASPTAATPSEAQP